MMFFLFHFLLFFHLFEISSIKRFKIVMISALLCMFQYSYFTSQFIHASLKVCPMFKGFQNILIKFLFPEFWIFWIVSLPFMKSTYRYIIYSTLCLFGHYITFSDICTYISSLVIPSHWLRFYFFRFEQQSFYL